MGEIFEQTQPKKMYSLANKHRRSCPKPLVIREMKIKTAMSYYHSPMRMAKLEK